MDSISFCDAFNFRRITFQRQHYTDNRCGAPEHYFGYMIKGEARLNDGCTEIHVAENDLFYIPRGCRYQSYWRADGDICFLSLGFSVFPNPQRRSYLLQKIDCTPPERALVQYFLENELTADCRSVATLYQLMAETSEHMALEIIDRRRDIVERAMLYMNRQKSISADEIARHCGVSASTLYQAFQKTLGKTPRTVWHEIQAQRATTLLTTTDLSVEEISERLGFSSTPHFRRVFEAQTGKTPRAVRRESPYFSPTGKN